MILISTPYTDQNVLNLELLVRNGKVETGCGDPHPDSANGYILILALKLLKDVDLLLFIQITAGIPILEKII